MLQHARQGVEIFAGNKPTAIVPQFGPGVGKQHEATVNGPVRQDIQQDPGIVSENTDIARILPVHFIEQRCDAVDEGFAADQSGIGVGAGLCGDMFATAEADFEP